MVKQEKNLNFLQVMFIYPFMLFPPKKISVQFHAVDLYDEYRAIFLAENWIFFGKGCMSTSK